MAPDGDARGQCDRGYRGDELNRVRLLTATSWLLLLGNIVGLVISVVAGWPAEFGGVGDPDNVAGEFLSRGTLLAAPLAPLVALVMSALLALRGGRWLSLLGLVGLMLIGGLFIVGTLGEPLRPVASRPPVAFLFAWQATFIAISAMQIVLAAIELWGRLRACPSTGPGRAET